MKLDVVEGVQAQIGLDVGMKGQIQQQVSSWENATVDIFMALSILVVLPSHIRAVRLALF